MPEDGNLQANQPGLLSGRVASFLRVTAQSSHRREFNRSKIYRLENFISVSPITSGLRLTLRLSSNSFRSEDFEMKQNL